MPTLAAELTEAERRRQLAVRARSIGDVSRLWPAFDITNTATWAAIEEALLTLIRRDGAISEGLAMRYFRDLREIEGITGSANPAAADAINEAQVRTSLRVTGLRTAQRAIENHRADASDVALVNVSGAVGRLVMNQGRGSLLNSIAADRQAVGWQRIGSIHPCAFCALLISRGPVYRTEQSADFRAHDHCACTVQPVWNRDQPWTDQATEFRKLYNDSTKGLSGADARNAFRRAFTL